MKSAELNINREIIYRCKKGEPKAQFILYKQYSKAMYNIAIRFLNNQMDAEDILQEYFITAFDKLNELTNDNAFGSWLKRIVINNCITHLRKRKIEFDDIEDFGTELLNSDDEGDISNDIININSNTRVITLSSIDKALGIREQEYKSLVSFKTYEVRSFEGSGNVIVSELFSEIKKLDIVYDQAMDDLKELGPNERVINTIFSTYEQRIRLLELIILETNKIKSHESNEKITL